MSKYPAWSTSSDEQGLPRCELSDLPRLLCGCPEHTRWNAELDFDDLEPAEHEYMNAEAETQQARHHVITIVPLPEYGKARPWTEATNVTLPKAGENCRACGEKPAGDAFICPECIDDLRVHLGDVVGLLDDLDVLADRQARVVVRPRKEKPTERTRWDSTLRPDPKDVQNPTVGKQLAAADYHRPLMVARAVGARDKLGNEVTTAVRILAEPRGVAVQPMDTREASRWLLGRLSAVAMDVAGQDICHEMQRAHDRAMNVIDNAEPGVYLGLCDRCQASMRADPDEREFQCRCPAVYDVATRREAQRRRVRDRLLSVSEIVTLSLADKVTFGRRVHKKQIQRWVEQRRLSPSGTRPNGDKGETSLYRATDVVELVAERCA